MWRERPVSTPRSTSRRSPELNLTDPDRRARALGSAQARHSSARLPTSGRSPRGLDGDLADFSAFDTCQRPGGADLDRAPSLTRDRCASRMSLTDGPGADLEQARASTCAQLPSSAHNCTTATCGCIVCPGQSCCRAVLAVKGSKALSAADLASMIAVDMTARDRGTAGAVGPAGAALGRGRRAAAR